MCAAARQRPAPAHQVTADAQHRQLIEYFTGQRECVGAATFGGRDERVDEQPARPVLWILGDGEVGQPGQDRLGRVGVPPQCLEPRPGVTEEFDIAKSVLVDRSRQRCVYGIPIAGSQQGEDAVLDGERQAPAVTGPAQHSDRGFGGLGCGCRVAGVQCVGEIDQGHALQARIAGDFAEPGRFPDV